nr:hypothetical protein [Tanacetum cinerariifolium]
MLLAAMGRSENGQPLQSSLTSVYEGHKHLTNIGGNIPPNGPTGNNIPTPHGFIHSLVSLPNNYLSYTQPMYPLPNALAYPNHGLQAFSQTTLAKWGMPVACHIFTYTLKDSSRIWWNSQKEGSILNYEDLKAKFWSHFRQQKKFKETYLAVHNIKQREGETRSLVEFLSTNLPTTYKVLPEKTYTWIEKKKVATNGTPNDHREGFDMIKENSSWDTNKGKKNRDRFSLYCGSDHGLLSNLSKSPREILIEEAVKSGKLGHLVKGIKKGTTKVPNTQLGERKKGDKDTAPVLMIKELASYFQRVKLTRWKKDIKAKKDSKEVLKGILSYLYAKERVVVNDEYLKQAIVIGKQLPTSFKKKLRNLLKLKTDVFAWTYTGLAPERNEATHKEVEELVKDNILREVKYQTWVSNPVMTKLPLLENVEELHKQEDGSIDHRGEIGFLKNEGVFRNITKLMAPIKGKALVMYLTISEESISAVLLAERGKRQVPIYFVCSHTIQILTDKLIKQILARLEKLGRIAKWAIKLGEHDIEFRGRNSIKGKILAYFLAEIPSKENKEREAKKTTGKEQKT